MRFVALIYMDDAFIPHYLETLFKFIRYGLKTWFEVDSHFYFNCLKERKYSIDIFLRQVITLAIKPLRQIFTHLVLQEFIAHKFDEKKINIFFSRVHFEYQTLLSRFFATIKQTRAQK